MKSKEGFLYRSTMKDSVKLYKDLGVTLIVFLVLFGAARDYIFIPLLGKIWGLALSTTPEGFISNANFLNAFLKSPWIIPIGAVLIILYAVISMWQVSAIIVGISYAHQGKRIKLWDLIKISFQQLNHRVNKNNWMLLVYSLIIVPFANVYQTNDVINAFVVPEYIQDFINEKAVLFILFTAVALFVTYIALRLFFLLPAFILKKKDYKEAKEESNALTKGNWFKTGVNVALYSLKEFIRLSLLPVVLVSLPVFICFCFTKKLEFSTQLYNAIGINLGLEIVKCITGTLVQISSICFMVELYFNKLKEKEMDDSLNLPLLKEERKDKISITKLQIICCCFYSFIIAVAYLSTVLLAQKNNEIIFDLFGRTEIIAHKGYCSKAPENTLPAFDLADECEAVSYIELDVWTSKDGVPVVIHNANILDATGVDKQIWDCTVDELRSLSAPYSKDKSEFAAAYIPTLEEVMQKYAASTPLLIEIKGFKQDPELSAKIVALMKKYGCEYTSLVHSGDYKAIEAVKKIDSDISCGLILAMVTGNYYDLPYADFFSIEHTFVSQNAISVLHRRGKNVFAWTVNYPESADALKFSGVDAIITDVPEEINEYVATSNDLVKEVVIKKLTAWFNENVSSLALEDFENGNY